jgi:hypothetical protein
MKKGILALLLVAALAVPAFAQEKGAGIGIAIGSQAGLSARLWIAKNVALTAALNFAYNDTYTTNGKSEFNSYLAVNCELYKFDLIKTDEDTGRYPVYIGIGTGVVLKKEPAAGIRVPLGVSAIPPDVPVDVFFEVAPAFLFGGGTRFDVLGTIGVRFYPGGSGAKTPEKKTSEI